MKFGDSGRRIGEQESKMKSRTFWILDRNWKWESEPCGRNQWTLNQWYGLVTLGMKTEFWWFWKHELEKKTNFWILERNWKWWFWRVEQSHGFGVHNRTVTNDRSGLWNGDILKKVIGLGCFFFFFSVFRHLDLNLCYICNIFFLVLSILIFRAQLLFMQPIYL